MGAVGSRKGVVAVDLAQAGQRSGEAGVVLLLLRVEADVLEQDQMPWLKGVHGVLGRLPDAVAREAHGQAHPRGQPLRHRLQ